MFLCVHQMNASCIELYTDLTLFNYLLSVKGYAHIDTFYLYINQTLDCIEQSDLRTYPFLINDDLSNNAHIKTFFNHFTCMILT